MSEEKFFRAIVLQALWILILCALGGRPRMRAADIRGEMIRYFDEHGNQSEGAAAYRRETTFPEIPVGY